MPLSHQVTKFHEDLNISTLILNESLCLSVLVAGKGISQSTQQ